MNYEDKDICERLYVATPYGLGDFNLLRDARNEILKLREQLAASETVERET
jgi:hypothetical protein